MTSNEALENTSDRGLKNNMKTLKCYSELLSLILILSGFPKTEKAQTKITSLSFIFIRITSTHLWKKLRET